MYKGGKSEGEEKGLKESAIGSRGTREEEIFAVISRVLRARRRFTPTQWPLQFAPLNTNDAFSYDISQRAREREKKRSRRFLNCFDPNHVSSKAGLLGYKAVNVRARFRQ